MSPEEAQVIQAYVAIGVGVVTIIGLLIASQQVRVAVRAQHEVRQPYVFVDVKHDALNHRWLCIAQNTGPAVAKHVKITFDPPLDSDAGEGAFEE